MIIAVLGRRIYNIMIGNSILYYYILLYFIISNTTRLSVTLVSDKNNVTHIIIKLLFLSGNK